ncbi:TIGR02450 family Trp-rich protein [Limnohabitans sp.]|uniref:TIGR02450 family Trp-rich protein n=1 Tax=Limnohabitans sp. TaxID=1907725 RepID=UPI0025C01E4A|nr:TIGR02450 family Trp-rich protein [Limnohabitans sp.]
MAKQKHFGVSRVIQPDGPTALIERVEIEVVFSKVVEELSWQELQDNGAWRQGWI